MYIDTYVYTHTYDTHTHIDIKAAPLSITVRDVNIYTCLFA